MAQAAERERMMLRWHEDDKELRPQEVTDSEEDEDEGKEKEEKQEAEGKQEDESEEEHRARMAELRAMWLSPISKDGASSNRIV